MDHTVSLLTWLFQCNLVSPSRFLLNIKTYKCNALYVETFLIRIKIVDCFHIVTKQYSLVNGKVSYSSIENATTLYKHHLNTSKLTDRPTFMTTTYKRGLPTTKILN